MIFMQAQLANNLSQNKHIAKDCLDLLFNRKKPSEAAARYIGEGYRQHNPEAADGPQGVIAYASSYNKNNPDAHMDFKRIIAEGNLVAVHSHLKRNTSDPGESIVDIFRVEDGKLVEHWDIVQLVPPRAENRNTMF